MTIERTGGGAGAGTVRRASAGSRHEPALLAAPATRTGRTWLPIAAAVVIDIMAVGGGYAMAAALRAPLPQYVPMLFATPFLWPVVFAAAGLYDPRRITGGWHQVRGLFGAVSVAMFLVIIGSFLSNQQDLSRGWIVTAWPSCLVTVAVSRALYNRAIRRIRTAGRLRSGVIIVGTNDEARGIARTIARQRWLGLDPVGFVCVVNGNGHAANGDGDGDGGNGHSKDECGEEIDGLRVLGYAKCMADIVRATGASMVLVATTSIPTEMLATLYRDLQDTDVDVRISAGVLNIAASRTAVEPLDGLPVIALRRMALPRGQAVVKRCFDVAVSSAVVLLLSPLMAVIALAVRLTSTGPALFRQLRVGQGGRPFTMFKFRTMVHDSEIRLHEIETGNEADGLLFKMKDDPRVTRVGRLLRRWSLDELPQLFNVLRGDMSLVGPRPPLPREVARYDAWLRRRLDVKPGITGLWQVNGRHDLTFEDYVRYDLYYVRNWSIALDIAILWRTIPAVMSRSGAY